MLTFADQLGLGFLCRFHAESDADDADWHDVLGMYWERSA